MSIWKQSAITMAALAVSSAASGHHSDAGIETESVIAFEGIVGEFAWQNPRVYVVVEPEIQHLCADLVIGRRPYEYED